MSNVLVLLGLAGVAYVVFSVFSAGSTPPRGSSRNPRQQRSHNRRSASYGAERSAQRQAARIRAEARRRVHIETARQHLQPDIDRANRRARKAADRALAGKRTRANPSKHDREETRLRGLQAKEVNLATRIWDMASGGHPKAQQMMGRIHPKTGQTVGGTGRAGYRPSDHPVKPPKPKGPGVVKGLKNIGKKLK